MAGGPGRDWPALEEALAGLGRARATMVARARERATARLARALGNEIAERDAALRRPLQDTEARVARLRAALQRAEQSLGDLGAMLVSTEVALSRAFDDRRREFLGRALPRAMAELDAAISAAAHTAGASLRTAALDQARAIAERHVHLFLEEAEPAAADLYTEATERFARLANGFLAEVGGQGADGGPGLTVEAGFQEPRHFFFASLMSRTQAGPLAWIADRLGLRRRARVRAHARSYLAELIDINGMRLVNDFRDRVLESRRGLEAEVRRCLEGAVAAGERALQGAIHMQEAGSEALAGELARLAALRREVEAIGGPGPAAEAGAGVAAAPLESVEEA
jgi:hypothetical protein